MKTTKIALMTAVALAAAGVVTSCGTKSETDLSASIKFSTLEGKAAYRLDNSAADYNRDADITYFDSASVLIPEDVYGKDIKALRDSIISAAFDTVAPQKEAMNGYFAAQAAEVGYKTTQLPASEAAMSSADGFSIVSGEVFNLNPHILTYLVTKNVQAPGGAHSEYSSRFFTYDIAGARLASLDDIFTADGLAQLPAIIRARAEQLAPAIGQTDVTALPADGNFYISLSDDVVFVYQPYEIASWAQGQISIPFHAYQLQDQMTEYGKHLTLLQ